MRTFSFLFLLLVILPAAGAAQRRPAAGNSSTPTRSAENQSSEIGQSAIVLDETLSLLRTSPSLFAPAIHRMQIGRRVQIQAVKEADGVKFYKVAAPPTSIGWVQADAVFGRFRKGDDARLVELIRVSTGFEQFELMRQYFELFPISYSRPAMLLLFGDLAEETAVKLSKDANRRLTRSHMAATGAPLHSYYLNFVGLDRYRKLGIIFLFDPVEKLFHYDGTSWKELAARFPDKPEAAEAVKRIEILNKKMAAAVGR